MQIYQMHDELLALVSSMKISNTIAAFMHGKWDSPLGNTAAVSLPQPDKS
jgi:hypothetical protein